jgi:predicted nuclease of predicted toxin-antitoxin system
VAKYLIDANLPYYFELWNNPYFIHVKDIDDSLSDEQIWDFAKQNDLIIVSKDADFSLKVLIKGPPPKVIHLKFGNLKMSAFHDIISKIWTEIEVKIEDHSLINVFIDRIESIK